MTSLALPRIVLATGNPSKLRLMQAITDGLAQSVLPSELAKCPDVSESGSTIQENALLKAAAYFDCSGIPALAGDSGLLLLDIPPNSPEQPGALIRRTVHGENTTDEEMLAYYMALAHRHGGRLRAAYQNALCLYAGPERYRMYLETPEACARNAFYLVDRPCALRRPGWPLDSLAVGIHTGRYFLEENQSAQSSAPAVAGSAQAYRPWLASALRALGYAPDTEDTAAYL